MQIAQEQKKMDSIFLAVGRKYYEMRVEETPEELKELVDQLKESENKIADLEKQCEEAKNVRFCRGCGEILGAEVVFCPHCGTQYESNNNLACSVYQPTENISNNKIGAEYSGCISVK